MLPAVDPARLDAPALELLGHEAVQGPVREQAHDPLDNPFLDLIGVRQRVWREGYAEFELPVRAALLNRQGLLQGGVLSTLLDVACGYAGLHSAPGRPLRHGHSVTLNVHYVNKCRSGVVIARGHLEHAGGRLFFSRAEAWLDGSLLLATAQGTYKCSARG